MQILCMGEALIDMLSTKGKPGVDENNESFRKFAGGAPANVAVAAAKLGGESYLFGKLGKDQFGDYLLKTLKALGVNTQFTTYSDKGKTALAFVGLDADGERSFDFYIDNAAHIDLSVKDLDDGLFACPRIVSFCSGSVSMPSLRDVTKEAIKGFKQAGCILCLDINLRPAFWDEAAFAPEQIDETARQVDFIKASKEELVELYGEANIEGRIQSWLAAGVSLVLVTNGGEPVVFYSKDTQGVFPTPDVNAVDTTAAGDAFVGGFLYQLSAKVTDCDSFKAWTQNAEEIMHTLQFATQCGAHAVSHYGAFDALPTQQDIQQQKA